MVTDVGFKPLHMVLQRKFNLLREESEGYAKMITLLSRSGPSGLSEVTADATARTNACSLLRLGSNAQKVWHLANILLRTMGSE